MAGHYSENEVAQAVRLGQLSQPGGAWDRIAARVEAIPEYRQRFDVVLGEGAPISFAEIGNILADFIRFEWRADDSPFDRYMSGQGQLSHVEQRGMMLFYGAAQCGTCHSGWFQTDHGFHALAMPQIGPGKAARFENHARDERRIRATGVGDHAYAFRTPSLRNVTLTGPYGHSGAYATLEGMLRHHLDPAARLADYDRGQAVLPPLEGSQDFRMLDDAEERAQMIAAAIPKGPDLDETQIAALIAFFGALTDDGAAGGRLGVPETVPSGLPVDR